MNHKHIMQFEQMCGCKGRGVYTRIYECVRARVCVCIVWVNVNENS